MRRIRIGLLVLLWCATEAVAHTSTTVPDDEIRRILLERVDVQKQSVGIVVGVIDRQGRRIVAYGSLDEGDPRKLDGDTLFEIGSATQVFTALLAADMARHGELKLNDRRMPERNDQQITNLNLATPTSGLTRLPTNIWPRGPMNQYADAGEQLFSFLSSYEVPRDTGVRYEYSKLDFDLLGQALARRAGTSYESLVVSRICDPLHMDNTRITLSDALRARLAVGHTPELVRTRNWDVPTLTGAGELYSSANDLLTLLAAMMDYTHNPLSAAQKIALRTTRPTGRPFEKTGLAWEIDSRGGGEIIYKDGGTEGYRAFIGYSPKHRVGVVALSNAEGGSTPDDIAFHLLDARYPPIVPLAAANSGKEP
jgi:D-alanyl-D-alanine-carboxypeptidase/D-alanyl-D-alanine-endopeptidase